MWVVPVCESARKTVESLDAQGQVSSMNFPIAWSYAHYRRTPATYKTRCRLGESDLETLCLLESMASWKDEGVIKCYQLIRARDDNSLKKALGVNGPLFSLFFTFFSSDEEYF